MPSTTRSLPNNSLHIWQIPLASSSIYAKEDFELLGKEEKKRAEAIHDSIAKQRFVRTHVAVRSILAGYLGIPVVQLRLANTALNKPILMPDLYDRDIRFNLSHSGDQAALAVALDIDLGIDLEQVNIKRNILGIVRRYFSEATVAAIMAQAEPQRKLSFLLAWTQYEAYKKAQVLGLRGGDPKLTLCLDEFTENQFRPLFTEQQPCLWQVAALRVMAGWVGAVVMPQNDVSVIIDYFNYEDIGRNTL